MVMAVDSPIKTIQFEMPVLVGFEVLSAVIRYREMLEPLIAHIDPLDRGRLMDRLRVGEDILRSGLDLT